MKIASPFFAALTICIFTADAYQLHEWGTFTTVSGSDGVLLSGLQREEEELPKFVHSHFGFENGQESNISKYRELSNSHGFKGFTPNLKGLGKRPLSNVTVKMETPVIYFHSDKAFRAQVRVGFEGGTISQWYPNRSAGETLPEPPPSSDPEKQPVPLEQWRMDFLKPYRGGIQWDIDVLSPSDSRAALLFKPQDTVNWIRARIPEANALRNTSGEIENYLFYRGLGNFKPGLLTTVSANETLNLVNQTGGDIPYLLIFERRGDRISWSARANGIKPNETLDLPEANLTVAAKGFPTPIYDSMKAGLTACGLLDSEAHAMIQTWWTSYFEAQGFRIFWVLPTSSTDRILPLTVTPAPDKIVRVLVGRSEVLRPRDEARWLGESRKPLSGENDPFAYWKALINTDRFGLAIEERVKALEATAATTDDL